MSCAGPRRLRLSSLGLRLQNAGTGNDLTSDVLGQTALSLSGALDHSRRTHIYAAGEYNREAKGSPITSPLAPGIFTGHYRGWLGTVRLDRQLNQNNNVFLRANMDSFSDTNPNGIVGGASLANVARTFRRRTYSGVSGRYGCPQRAPGEQRAAAIPAGLTHHRI